MKELKDIKKYIDENHATGLTEGQKESRSNERTKNTLKGNCLIDVTIGN